MVQTRVSLLAAPSASYEVQLALMPHAEAAGSIQLHPTVGYFKDHGDGHFPSKPLAGPKLQHIRHERCMQSTDLTLDPRPVLTCTAFYL